MQKISLILFVLLSGCIHCRIFVNPVSKNSNLPNNSYVYALPQTCLLLKVETIRNTYIKGPYASYAEKYLGLKDIAQLDHISWKLGQINIETFNEADTSRYYSLKVKGTMPSGTIKQLSDDGLIINPYGSVPVKYNQTLKNDTLPTSTVFTSLSIQNFYAERKDTLYKIVMRDSMYVKLPVLKNSIVDKSTEEKAREAADLIMKIRTRRMDMVLDEDEKLPDAESMKVALDVMNKKEKEYLSLFTGKNFTQHFVNNIIYVPSASKGISNTELFGFSSDEGIIQIQDAESPVILRISNTGKTEPLNNLSGLNKKTFHQLLVRIPEVALAELIYEGDVISSSRILISQYGAIVPLPLNREQK